MFMLFVVEMPLMFSIMPAASILASIDLEHKIVVRHLGCRDSTALPSGGRFRKLSAEVEFSMKDSARLPPPVGRGLLLLGTSWDVTHSKSSITNITSRSPTKYVMMAEALL
jgi:hypothetical protein